jgi:hypothetical protein
MGTLPGIVIMAPADEVELMRMIRTAHEIDDMPSVVRYPRGTGYGPDGLKKVFGYELVDDKVPTPAEVTSLPVGIGRIMRNAEADSKQKVPANPPPNANPATRLPQSRVHRALSSVCFIGFLCKTSCFQLHWLVVGARRKRLLAGVQLL